MASWMHILDYIPVIGAVKNVGEAVVAFADGDYRTGASKTAEAAIGGFLDCMTFGAGKMIGTAVVKGIGKEVAVKVSTVAAATAVRMVTINKAKFLRSGTANRHYSHNGKNKNTCVQSCDGDQDGRPPNDNNSNINPISVMCRKHVINIKVVDLVKKIIDEFMRRIGFPFEEMVERGHITMGMYVYRHYYNSLPPLIVYNIQNLMVLVNNTQYGQNPATFDNYRQRLENAVLEFMMVLFDLENGHDVSPEQRLNALANVNSLLETMIGDSVFIDELVQADWYNEGQNENERERRRRMFDEAQNAVEIMLDRLARRAELWVTEIVLAIKGIRNSNN